MRINVKFFDGDDVLQEWVNAEHYPLVGEEVLINYKYYYLVTRVVHSGQFHTNVYCEERQ